MGRQVVLDGTISLICPACTGPHKVRRRQVGWATSRHPLTSNFAPDPNPSRAVGAVPVRTYKVLRIIFVVFCIAFVNQRYTLFA